MHIFSANKLAKTSVIVGYTTKLTLKSKTTAEFPTQTPHFPPVFIVWCIFIVRLLFTINNSIVTFDIHYVDTRCEIESERDGRGWERERNGNKHGKVRDECKHLKQFVWWNSWMNGLHVPIEEQLCKAKEMETAIWLANILNGNIEMLNWMRQTYWNDWKFKANTSVFIV